ncbi:TRAP transporter small permease [Metallumcola ferriviriculae]|uniref:TRAP transporter small permease n=1 Tax=Metallumcola ferriviriculae TaxID=3039180 RepID=A0AAU0UR31_9FIRM|nr:TRAP transporter small permease [Desulfitibacteraceae bacterium MK1]
MRPIKLGFDKIDKFLYRLGLWGIFVMMLLITLDAAGRYFLRDPIDGAFEFVQDYLMVAVVFLSMSYTYKTDSHIRLELFARKFPERLKRVFFYINNLLPLVFFFIIAREGWVKTWEAWVGNEFTIGVVSWPTYLSYIWIPVGVGILVLRIGFTVAEQVIMDIDCLRQGVNSQDEGRGSS